MISPKTKCPLCGASRDYLKVTKDGLKCLLCGHARAFRVAEEN